MKLRKDFRKYQIVFLNKIKKLESVILALPMGSGKTALSLTAVIDLLDDEIVKRVLVVAPMLVAKVSWPDEIEEWEHLKDLQSTLIRCEDDDHRLPDVVKAARDTAKNIIGLQDAKEISSFVSRRKTNFKTSVRANLANDGRELHIINKEALPWLWEHFDNGATWPYDMLIIDEASMFKNAKKRTPLKKLSRFGVMSKARASSKKTVLLSGTPAPKGLPNLWGLAYIADLGERLGSRKDMFEKRYFEKDYMGWNMEPRPNAENLIMDKLSDIMFSIREEDCVDLPKFIPLVRKATLSKRNLEEYKKFEADLYSQRYDVEAVNKGVLHNKLLQFANGSMYQEDRKSVWIHDQKLEILESLVEEADDTPVLIGYNFKFDLERIKKLYPKAVVFGQGDARKTKADWNAGKIPILLAHPSSVGHGQNLQFGSNIGIWYGLTPDLEIYQQFNKRLHRPGQTLPVFMYHIVTEDTLDEELIPILTKKDATQQRILDLVRLSYSLPKSIDFRGSMI